MTISAQHASVGDLKLELIAPGATSGQPNRSKVIFTRTGSSSGPGDESTLDGTYVFADTAPVSPTWWGKAASTGEGQPILSGFYRASLANGSNTTITPDFFSVPNMNGTWTLRVSDGRGGGIGQITAASIDLTGSVAATPSSLVGGIADNGTNKNVTFPISGLNGAPSSVTVSMTFNPTHPFAGDIESILFAPNNTQATIFSRTGLTSGTPNGDDSDLTGPYLFFDNNSNNWWAAAASAGSGTAIPSTSYRTSDTTGANTLINPVFATVANPNGTWTLRFRDLAGGDSGGVGAAELSIIEGTDTTPPTAPSLSGTDPASPSSSNTPRFKGSAPAGTIVRIHSDAFSCNSGNVVAAGSPELLAGAGIPVNVADNASVTWRRARWTLGTARRVPISCSTRRTPQRPLCPRSAEPIRSPRRTRTSRSSKGTPRLVQR